jgi:hypothetical protein
MTLYSVRAADKSLSKIFTGQMDSSYFPVDLGDMMAHLEFVELEGLIELGSAKIAHFYLNHPGLAVGFRIESEGKTVVYITDHEPYCRLSGDNDHNRKLDREVDGFARGADLYIREAPVHGGRVRREAWLGSQHLERCGGLCPLGAGQAAGPFPSRPDAR